MLVGGAFQHGFYRPNLSDLPIDRRWRFRMISKEAKLSDLL